MLDFFGFGGFVPLAVSSADSADTVVFGFLDFDLLFGASGAGGSLTLDSESTGDFEDPLTFDLILLAKLLEVAIGGSAPGSVPGGSGSGRTFDLLLGVENDSLFRFPFSSASGVKPC